MGLILYISSILRQRIKYFGDFYVSFFDIFLLVGKKRGDGFYVGFQKMVNVYFMYHPSGWDIKYTFSLYYLDAAALASSDRPLATPARHPH